MEKEQLAALAKTAMQTAYAPYSGYTVGAALLCDDGTVYTGCNVENASYGATNCAERTVFFKAISEGKRRFRAIAICGGKHGVVFDEFTPCGICRQVMREFCDDDFLIYVVSKTDISVYCLGELLPNSFGPSQICKNT